MTIEQGTFGTFVSRLAGKNILINFSGAVVSLFLHLSFFVT